MIEIGIIGDFNAQARSHPATGDALDHAARAFGIDLEVSWQPTLGLAGQDGERRLDQFDGLWIASGSPYQSMDGALKAIRFARERGRPLVAT